MKLWELDEIIREVCPIDGINSNGEIFFRAEATVEQRTAAHALMDAQRGMLE